MHLWSYVNPDLIALRFMRCGCWETRIIVLLPIYSDEHLLEIMTITYKLESVQKSRWINVAIVSNQCTNQSMAWAWPPCNVYDHQLIPTITRCLLIYHDSLLSTHHGHFELSNDLDMLQDRMNHEEKDDLWKKKTMFI